MYKIIKYYTKDLDFNNKTNLEKKIIPILVIFKLHLVIPCNSFNNLGSAKFPFIAIIQF